MDMETSALLYSFVGLTAGLLVIPLLTSISLRLLQSRISHFSATLTRAVWRAALVTSLLFVGAELTGMSNMLVLVANRVGSDAKAPFPADVPTDVSSDALVQSDYTRLPHEYSAHLAPVFDPTTWDEIPHSSPTRRLAPNHWQPYGGEAMQGPHRFEVPDRAIEFSRSMEASNHEFAFEPMDGEARLLRADNRVLDPLREQKEQREQGDDEHRPALLSANEIADPIVPRAFPRLAITLMACWAGVSLVMVGRLWFAHVYWRRIARRAPASHPLAGRIDAIWESMRGRSRVRLIETNRVTSPVAFGLWQPCIMIPLNFQSQLDAPRRDAVLAHELAHLASRDPLWQAVCDLFCGLFWWHPGAWWTRQQLREAAEFAADESSAMLPDGPHLLASSLVAIARNMSQAQPLAAVPIGGRFRSALSRRVTRLLHQSRSAQPSTRGRSRSLFCAALVLLLAAATTCAAWGRPQAVTSSERTNMKLLKSSWSRSIAAAAVVTLTTISGGNNVATENTVQASLLDDEREGDERREGDEERERDERRDGDRERGERERGERERGERREGERERGDGERREGERDDERRENAERNRERNAVAGEFSKLAALRKALQLRLAQVEQQLKRDPKEGGEERRRYVESLRQSLRSVESRLESTGRALRENSRSITLEEAPGPGEEERERERYARGGERRPEERHDERRARIMAAMEHLHAAGYEEEAGRLRRLLGDDAPPPREREGARRFLNPRRGEEEGPHAELAEIVQHLAHQVERLSREMQEVRNHLRELHPDRARHDEREHFERERAAFERAVREREGRERPDSPERERRESPERERRDSPERERRDSPERERREGGR